MEDYVIHTNNLHSFYLRRRQLHLLREKQIINDFKTNYSNYFHVLLNLFHCTPLIEIKCSNIPQTVMQCQCISKIVIYNMVFNATPFTCFVNTKRVADMATSMYCSLERELKNVAQDVQRYLQKWTSTGKSENSVWICSIFWIMWVKFSSKFQSSFWF